MDESNQERYDRQRRLWGDEGQRSIKEMNVCVFGSSSLASEILKSLVLAGIGEFCLVDDMYVAERDLGRNFFVEESSLGKSRAEEVTRLLKELNPEVRGQAVNSSFINFFEKKRQTLSKFSVVICTDLPETDVFGLSDYLYKKGVPLVYSSLNGLIGYLQISFKEHYFLNSHSESNSHDLRLDSPFDEFHKYFNSFDLELMQEEERIHLPYAVIYAIALTKWRQSLGNPTLYPSKAEHRQQLLEKMIDLNCLGGAEKFDEVRKNLIKGFDKNEIPCNVRQVFNDQKSNNITDPDKYTEEMIKPFWILATALKMFCAENSERLPLSGLLPDMHSSPQRYNELLTIFRKKACEDAERFFSIAKTVQGRRMELHKQRQGSQCQSNGSPCRKKRRISVEHRGQTAEEIGEKEQNDEHLIPDVSWLTLDVCKQFCKNARNIGIQYGNKLSLDEATMQELSDQLIPPEAEGEPPLIDPQTWIFLFKASNFMLMKDDSGKQFVDDVDQFKRFIAETFGASVCNKIDDRSISEFVRYGGSEIIGVASIIGGVISQEVIKLCTHQFVPIDNTLVFDAMTGNSASVRLGGTCVQNSDATMNMVQNDTFDGTTDSSQQTNASVDTDMLDLSTDVDEQQTSSSQNIGDGENGWQTIIQGFSSGKWADIRCLTDNASSFVSSDDFEPGEENLEKVKQCAVLVVGAGGLGCEILKNLALLGFKHIDVIDMDTIELSNLNRQFLFRETDIGKFKAQVAADFIKARVPDMDIKAYNCRIEKMEDKFYEDHNIIICGLDSIEARNWLNSTLCDIVRSHRDADDFDPVLALIDGGTEGFKGDARVSIPFLTPCIKCHNLYPPEEDFPLCTIENIPRRPEHCIVYVKMKLWESEKPFNGAALDADDPAHLNWVHQKAQERANEYKIDGVEFEFTRTVLKHIIPAVASTNAVIAAICAMEAFKLASNVSPTIHTHLNFTQTEGACFSVVSLDRSEKRCETCGDAVPVEPTQTLGKFFQQICDFYHLDSPHFAETADGSLLLYKHEKGMSEEHLKEMEANKNKTLRELGIFQQNSIILVRDKSLEAEKSLPIRIRFTS